VDVRPGAEGWTDLAHALDLRAGLLVGEATIRGAIERRETRGAHNRADHPDVDPALRVNFHASLDDGALVMWDEPVPAMTGDLREWAERPVELSGNRLLE
jgi:succinate dehydrogenase / fumarate reductase flavoprotein subunit